MAAGHGRRKAEGTEHLKRRPYQERTEGYEEQVNGGAVCLLFVCAAGWAFAEVALRQHFTAQYHYWFFCEKMHFGIRWGSYLLFA